MDIKNYNNYHFIGCGGAGMVGMAVAVGVTLLTLGTTGALDPLTKELIYLAVSISQQCEYCTASHSYQARAKGASEAMMAEMFAIVGLAVEGNRMASAYRIPVDEKFK